jgi:protein SCO1/2
MKRISYLISSLVFIGLCSCSEKSNEPLPILGFSKIENGQEKLHQIPDFRFLDQDSSWIDNDYFKDNIYIADFFFTTCPSICPITTRSMLKIYEEFEHENLVKLCSYTLDPEYDKVNILKNYADNLEVNSDKWTFLTGDKDSIYDLTESYFSVVIEDDEAPGGINHSGKLLLIDKERHIRAFCEGTDPDDVDDFIKDIKKLIREYAE